LHNIYRYILEFHFPFLLVAIAMLVHLLAVAAPSLRPLSFAAASMALAIAPLT